MNVGQNVRIRDFMGEKGCCYIAEATNGLYGTDFKNVGTLLNELKNVELDAIILSPGEARKHYQNFKSKQFPALIVRCDWSNYKLDEKSIYPAKDFRHVTIASVEEASRIGASAVIMDLFFGVTDDNNVENIKMIRKLAEDGYDFGMPVIANIIPYGDRVDSKNFADVALLGMRIALEIGVTAVAIPALSLDYVTKALKSSIESPIFLNNNTPSSISLGRKDSDSMKANIDKGIRGAIFDGFNTKSFI